MKETFKRLVDQLFWYVMDTIDNNKIVINNSNIIIRDDADKPIVYTKIDVRSAIQKHSSTKLIE